MVVIVMMAIVIMAVGMVVMTVVIVVMVIVVMVMMGVRRNRLVSTTLGLERRVDDGDLGAQAGKQRLNGRIACQSQPALQDLDRHVTVAQVPSYTGKSRQVGGTHFDQRLRLGNDLDQMAVVKHQSVVGAHPRRLSEIDLNARAFDAKQEALLHLALCIGKDQRVDDVTVFAVGSRLNASRARHGKSESGGAAKALS